MIVKSAPKRQPRMGMKPIIKPTARLPGSFKYAERKTNLPTKKRSPRAAPMFSLTKYPNIHNDGIKMTICSIVF